MLFLAIRQCLPDFRLKNNDRVCWAFAKTQPRKQQVGSKNKLVRRGGKCVILENVDILAMASFLELLSLLEFWALMLPCQKFSPQSFGPLCPAPGDMSSCTPLRYTTDKSLASERVRGKDLLLKTVSLSNKSVHSLCFWKLADRKRGRSRCYFLYLKWTKTRLRASVNLKKNLKPSKSFFASCTVEENWRHLPRLWDCDIDVGLLVRKNVF